MRTGVVTQGATLCLEHVQPSELWFPFWLLDFQSSSLLMYLGTQWKMTQVVATFMGDLNVFGYCGYVRNDPAVARFFFS